MITHVFAGQPLDRLDHLRGEPGEDDAESRVLVVAEGLVLLEDGEEPKIAALTKDDLPPGAEITFLGRSPETPYGCVSATASELERLRARVGGKIVPIRTAAQCLPRADASILAYAHALAAWQARSRFCGSCGAPNRLEHSGHRRACTAPDCSAIQFPRTDPSVIGILTHGEECLLVSQPQWPEGRFATVAGFVEPGESLEEAMEREIAEEVGLRVTSMRYHSSQPWPFPMSLMIGFEVELASRDEPSPSNEIREARWYSRAGLRSDLRDQRISISTPMSISFALIASWYGDREDLEDLVAKGPEWR